MSRPRTAVIGLAALVLLLGVALVLPRGGQEDAALTPQARQQGEQLDPFSQATAGAGVVGVDAQAEIERVLRQGRVANARLRARSGPELRVLARAVAAAAATNGAHRPAVLRRSRAEQKAASLEQAMGGTLGGALVRASVRCADLEGQTYCLGNGWTTDSQARVRTQTLASARRAASRGRMGRTGTGDLDVVAGLSQQARLSPMARERAERRELGAAARSVAKVWLIRHQIEGVALPAGFAQAHPEIVVPGAAPSRTLARTTPEEEAAKQAHKAKKAKEKARTAKWACVRGQRAKGVEAATALKRCKRAAAAKAAAENPPVVPSVVPVPVPDPATVAPPVTDPAAPPAITDPAAVPAAPVEKTYDAYPPIVGILDKTKVAEQTVNYWCGPTAMQMIGWSWSGVDEGQPTWARRLGTTRSGSSISRMVRAVNDYTGYDDPTYAGPYVALDISSYTYDQWMLLMMQHVADLRSPVVLHPVLLKKYYPYLDDNASGHFQVGRGYDKKGARSDLIGYFEPWNQQRFDPSEPSISRVQWRTAYKSYRANQEHFQHNVGV